MKKTVILTKFLLTSCLLLAAASCQKVETELVPDQKVEAVFNVGVAELSATRSAIRNDEFRGGDKLGVYAAAYYNSTTPTNLFESGNYQDNVCFTAGGSNMSKPTNWTSNPKIYYPENSVDFYAYYPYSADFTPTTTTDRIPLTVPADQSTEDLVRSADFMTAQTLGRKSTDSPNTIPLQFFHRYSKLTVQFQIPSTYKSKTFNGVSQVTIKNVKNEVSVDFTSPYTYLADGTPSTLGADGAIYPKPAVLTQNSSNVDIAPYLVQKGNNNATPTIYEVILAPQTLSAKHHLVKVVLEYSCGSTPEEFTFTLKDDLTFKAGQSTRIVLTISDYVGDDGAASENVEIKPGDITIIGWDETQLEGTTQKLHRMIFDVAESAQVDIRKDGAVAELTIQSRKYNAIVEYDTSNNRYLLQYDPGESFGGQLQAFTIRTDDNIQVVSFSSLTDLYIKGDPSTDDYAHVIGYIGKRDATYTITAGPRPE